MGHDEDHVLLRVGPNYRGKPKRLLTQAELVLRGLRAGPLTPFQPAHSTVSSNTPSIASEACSQAKKERAQAAVVDVVREVLQETAEAAAKSAEGEKR